jgi:CHAT domain-containing protein
VADAAADRPAGSRDASGAEAGPGPAADARSRAWALKDACYQAWHTAPPRARDAADALAALARAAPLDTELQALAAWTEGIAVLTEGRLGDALAPLETAQSRFAMRGDGQHAAEAQVPQMVVLAMLGRDAEAMQRGASALAQFAAVGDERSAGKIEVNLGTMLSRQDRHAGAAEHFRRAAVRFARAGDAEGSIMADGALGNALTWQYRLDEALRIFERGRMRAQARGFPILLAQMHQGLGRIALNRGRWHRALRELAEACRLLTDAGAPPPRIVEAEAALADAYLGVNLLAEAVAVYDRVIAAAQAMQAPTEEAWAVLQRARALARMGRHTDALDGFERARDRYEAAGNRPTLGVVTIARGRSELATGDAAAASASAAEALAALDGSGIAGWQLEARALQAQALLAQGDGAGAGQGFAAVLADAGDLPQIALQCHAGLGTLAWRAGDLRRARRALEAALDAVDRERAALPADEFRSAVAAEAELAHRQLVEVALAEGDSAQLLADLERGQSRALALSLGDDAAAGAAATGSTRLAWLREQWRQAMAEGDADRVPALAQQVQALEHDLLEAHRRAQLQAAGGGSDASGALDTDALQRALGAATALVVYHLLPGRLVACVVTGDAVRHAAWPVDDLAERVHALRFQLDALRFGGHALQRHGAQLLARVRRHLQGLHERVWAPLQPLLGGRTQVVVVPHHTLHYVPFAALHDGTQWLVQTHRLGLASSASVWLAHRRTAPSAGERLLAFGVGGQALPQVARELAAVCAHFGEGARIFREDKATRAALWAEAPAADLLHLACHGRFRADNPAFSSLQLGDGPLPLQDLRGLRLRARLVVLSACETGLSRLAPGDEVLGLVRAFTLAGAGAVLASLWPVDDAASADLIDRFYAGLRAGDDIVTALQAAQAEAAAAGAHPFHWAAFQAYGHAQGAPPRTR